MDFSWSEDISSQFDATVKFCRQSLNGSLSERLESRRFARAEWDACGAHGLLGLCVPEDYGGMGLGCVDTARLTEAFGLGCEDMGLVFSASAHQFACVAPIVDNGSEALKRELLPDLASGKRIAANAMTEPEAGSDSSALKSTAKLDGEVYRLDGVKSYVTNGPVCDLLLVYANVNPAWGFMGITAFMVDRDTPGVTIGEPFHKMGLETSPICSVYFEDAPVPVSRRVGDEGDGAKIFANSMHWERGCLFAAYLGLMQRNLDRAIEYARERRQFKQPIGRFQAISHKIVDMKVRLDAARLLLYRACWQRDNGHEATAEIAMSKLAISESAVQSGLDLIQIFGGIGYTREAQVERSLRDSIASTLFSGTSEIQRNLIATALGL